MKRKKKGLFSFLSWLAPKKKRKQIKKTSQDSMDLKIEEKKTELKNWPSDFIHQEPSNDETDEKLINSLEAAEIMGRTIQQFYSFINDRKKSGKPYPKQYGNGRPYYKRSEILKFNEQTAKIKPKGFRRGPIRSPDTIAIANALSVLPINSWTSYKIANGLSPASAPSCTNRIAKQLGIKVVTKMTGDVIHIKRSS